MGNRRSSRFVLQAIASAVLPPVTFGALLFGSAGTLAWWRAWVLVGVTAAASALATRVPIRGGEGLLDERFKPPIQAGQPVADRVILLAFIATFMGLVAFVPLDVFRLHLLGRPDWVVALGGLGLFLAGWWLIGVGLAANRFAAPVVKLQPERGQRVVDAGAYAVVRHPMYGGVSLLLVGLPLWLESWAGALAAVVPIGLLVARILVEERFLGARLDGYAAYAERVRYRLIPFVW